MFSYFLHHIEPSLGTQQQVAWPHLQDRKKKKHPLFAWHCLKQLMFNTLSFSNYRSHLITYKFSSRRQYVEFSYSWWPESNYVRFFPGGHSYENWVGRAARFPKPLPFLWSKSAIFPTLFLTWPKIWYPIYGLSLPVLDLYCNYFPSSDQC